MDNGVFGLQYRRLYSMNIGSYIVLGILIIIVALIIRSMVKKKKNGGGCSGNCGSCGGCGFSSCPSPGKDDENK